MKIISLMVGLILIVSLGSSTAQNVLGDNDNVYISPNGSDMGDGTISNPFRSLTKAVSVINDGGIIHVANGSYTDNNLEINRSMSIVKDNNVPGSGKEAIINAQNTDQIFYVTDDVNLNLNGLVLINGNAGASKNYHGGALDNEGNSTLLKTIKLQNPGEL